VYRSLVIELLALLVSLVMGASAFLLSALLLPEEEDGSEGYAVLSVDAAFPDREVGRRIVAAKFAAAKFAADYSSEATQWVFLSDFDTMLRLSLDEYDERLAVIAPFRDPRDDGYAARLRAFFVRDDGRRLFFIPFTRPTLREELFTRFLHQSRSGNREIESALTETLADIPFSLEWLGHDRKPFWLYFALFDALCVLAALLTRGALLLRAKFPASAGAAAPCTAAQGAAFIAAGLLIAVALATLRVLPALEEALLLYHAPQGFPCELIDEAEYLAHVEFQTSFMARPFYSLNTKAYLRYDSGADGLITETEVPAGVMIVDAPPFPLKKLMRFLAGAD
jgi:hypothetical protein